MANYLTAVRLLLVAPFAYCVAGGGRATALAGLILFAIALGTDFADGPLARRQGTVTALSGTFDHLSDFLFVVSATLAGAWRGAFPWVYPALIAAAFLQYVIDSYWGQRLKPPTGAADTSELKLQPTKQEPAEHQTSRRKQMWRGLRGSWLGRWNGILYFAPPCAYCVIRLGAGFLALPLRIFVWGLVGSTVISMAQRLAFRGKFTRAF